jgi:hypothetical protein
MVGGEILLVFFRFILLFFFSFAFGDSEVMMRELKEEDGLLVRCLCVLWLMAVSCELRLLLLLLLLLTTDD